MITYRELYEEGKQSLNASGIAEAELDARLLLEYVCGTDRNTLLVHGDRGVSREEEMHFRDLLMLRVCHVPLQQLTGTQSFMGLDFLVNGNVLIPRQDTEILVEEVLQNIHAGMSVLDMCTGSGCILISILKYSLNCTGVGVDLSGEALAVAKQNAEALMPEGDIEFVQSDLFEQLEGKFDILVSNPPYIRSDVIPTLMPEVREHEPLMALDGREDGLYFYRKIVTECKQNLKMGGMLFFEIGYDQGEAVQKLMEENGFLEVTVKQDYAGLDRVVYGTLEFHFDD